ncbi:MAG: hypothetical protein AAFY76_00740 [Cyanobacteria bacterium J06649_11]
MNGIRKVWWPKHQKDELVIITENSIVKGKVKQDRLYETKAQISNDQIPGFLFSVPFTYIRRVDFSDAMKYIEVHLKKDDSVQIRVQDESLRLEVFEYLKELLSDFQYAHKQESLWRKIKGTIIAFVVLNGILLWSYQVAGMIERQEYIGTQLVIVAAVAGLGTRTLILVIVAINILLISNLIMKVRNRRMLHSLSK